MGLIVGATGNALVLAGTPCGQACSKVIGTVYVILGTFHLSVAVLIFVVLYVKTSRYLVLRWPAHLSIVMDTALWASPFSVIPIAAFAVEHSLNSLSVGILSGPVIGACVGATVCLLTIATLTRHLQVQTEWPKPT